MTCLLPDTKNGDAAGRLDDPCLHASSGYRKKHPRKGLNNVRGSSTKSVISAFYPNKLNDKMKKLVTQN
ncbi:MAG TPA: hypothetical protein VFM18_16825 [Methanosarcina sp.]|nr:hypothetical protein [Methanosarcina sp.]